MNFLRRGMTVRIRPEWDGDAIHFIITEWNGRRGFIAPVHWPYGEIPPQELVSGEMIEEVRLTTPQT
jgi:hypothetical protein